MAATTGGLFIPSRKIEASARGVQRQRRISPEAGHALEILGHAIEYLADEYVHKGGSLSGSDPRLQAVQMLMAVNRQIYFECPEVPTIGERLRALFFSPAH